jgi:hypothetical protein
MLRCLLTLVCLGGFVPASVAQERLTVEQRVALALATGKKPGACDSCVACSCQSGECGDATCPTFRSSRALRCGDIGCPPRIPGDWLMYKIGYEKAISSNLPLLVWVGETCISCEKQWTEYVHCNISVFDSGVVDAQVTTYLGPGVMVLKPDGLGGMTIVGKLSGIPTKEQVDSALNPLPAVIQKTAQPRMPMPMMGGFGGGMMMGGCGGGG